MSPDVQMICGKCMEQTQVREILFLIRGTFEVVCDKCGKAQVYGERKE
jgi:hypothetical protein